MLRAEVEVDFCDVTQSHVPGLTEQRKAERTFGWWCSRRVGVAKHREASAWHIDCGGGSPSFTQKICKVSGCWITPTHSSCWRI